MTLTSSADIQFQFGLTIGIAFTRKFVTHADFTLARPVPRSVPNIGHDPALSERRAFLAERGALFAAKSKVAKQVWAFSYLASHSQRLTPT